MFQFIPSLLDRLLDTEPQRLKGSLRRDLANLLNTRQEVPTELLSEYVELAASLYTYGLPDLTSFNPKSTDDCRRVQRTLEQAIARHEPRLVHVRVHPPSCGTDNILRFPVEAVLCEDHTTEQMSFTTLLYLQTHTYEVQGQD